jgi:transcriptional regulator with XRE-family HTH domain
MKKIDGKKLRNLRMKKEFTVSGLAKKANVSEKTIEGVESGRRQRYTDATLIALARAFEIEVLELETAIALDEPATKSA